MPRGISDRAYLEKNRFGILLPKKSIDIVFRFVYTYTLKDGYCKPYILDEEEMVSFKPSWKKPEGRHLDNLKVGFMKKKKKQKHPFDVTESKARKIADDFCEYFDLTPINVFFVKFMKRPDIEDPEAVGWYSKHSNIPAYMIVEKNWSRRLVVVLHELTHHLQEEKYSTIFDSMHGNSFQLAKRRMHNWAKKYISPNYHWQFLVQKTATGHLVKPKKKGKKK